MPFEVSIHKRNDYIHIVLNGEVAAGDVSHHENPWQRVIDECRSHDCSRVIVDLRLAVTEHLSVLSLFMLAKHLRVIRDESIQLAFLVRTDQRRPDRFFETVLFNRGINFQFFYQHVDILNWFGHVLAGSDCSCHPA